MNHLVDACDNIWWLIVYVVFYLLNIWISLGTPTRLHVLIYIILRFLPEYECRL